MVSKKGKEPLSGQWKIALVIIIAAVCIGVALYLLLKERVSEADGPPAVAVDGYIIDKNTGIADNFKNGKVVIEIQVYAGDIDDVLDLEEPMQITITGKDKMWSVPSINLRDNSGKTETNYEENIECDGVIEGPSDSEDNIYVKISVPTTSAGEVVKGMSIWIDMWPTDDAVEAVDGNISPASFDNLSTYDWWNENDIIGIHISGKMDELWLFGYLGAYLIGTEVDE